MDINLSKLHKTVKDKGAWHAAVHGGHKELDMTEQLNNTNNIHNTKASTSESESESHSVMSDYLQPHGLYSPGILQARLLEWVDVPFNSRSSQPRDWSQVSLTAGGFFLPAEPQGKHSLYNVNLKNAIIKCKAGNYSIWSGEKFITWVVYA